MPAKSGATRRRTIERLLDAMPANKVRRIAHQICGIDVWEYPGDLNAIKHLMVEMFDKDKKIAQSMKEEIADYINFVL